MLNKMSLSHIITSFSYHIISNQLFRLKEVKPYNVVFCVLKFDCSRGVNNGKGISCGIAKASVQLFHNISF